MFGRAVLVGVGVRGKGSCVCVEKGVVAMISLFVGILEYGVDEWEEKEGHALVGRDVVAMGIFFSGMVGRVGYIAGTGMMWAKIKLESGGFWSVAVTGSGDYL